MVAWLPNPFLYPVRYVLSGKLDWIFSKTGLNTPSTLTRKEKEETKTPIVGLREQEATLGDAKRGGCTGKILLHFQLDSTEDLEKGGDSYLRACSY